MHRQTIAAFDFDGTITTRDTLPALIIFHFGVIRFLIGMIVCAPVLVGYVLGFIKNDIAKRKVFRHFFAGLSSSDFEKICNRFADARIESMVRPEARDRIAWHREQRHRLVIVTASLETWVAPWALKHGFEKVIGTQPEIKNNVLTGNFSTPNCYGEEKKRRLYALYPERNSYELFAYGNGRGDMALLQSADRAYFQNFHTPS